MVHCRSVIVPNDLTAFEASLTPEPLAATIASISDGGIHLSLPRWTARTHLTLNDALAALGMPTAFGGEADFSGMVAGGGLWIDRVEHEAFVEVDEDGTRAAAATGGVMEGSHGPTVEVNRPYLFIIRDRGAGTTLFIRRVTDPSMTPDDAEAGRSTRFDAYTAGRVALRSSSWMPLSCSNSRTDATSRRRRRGSIAAVSTRLRPHRIPPPSPSTRLRELSASLVGNS